MEISQPCDLTVLRVSGREIVDRLNFAECHDEFMDLIKYYYCRLLLPDLALDMSGVRPIPRGLLEVLMSVYRQRVDIHLYNASKDIRGVLRITKIDLI